MNTMETTITYDKQTEQEALNEYLELRKQGAKLVGLSVDPDTFTVTLTIELKEAGK